MVGIFDEKAGWYSRTGGDYYDNAVMWAGGHLLLEELLPRDCFSYKQGIWNGSVQLYILDLCYHCPYYGIMTESPAGH